MSKKQVLEIRKLAIANYWAKFGTFKAVLLDLPTANNLFPPAFPHITPSTTTHLFVSIAKRIQVAKLKKKGYSSSIGSKTRLFNYKKK